MKLKREWKEGDDGEGRKKKKKNGVKKMKEPSGWETFFHK